MLKTLFLLIFSFTVSAQEIGFFNSIQCEPDKKNKGLAVEISFYKEDAIVKIYEYNEKGKREDLFPARVIKTHVFLSRLFCKFHVISKRPSAEMFHFAMTVQDLPKEEIDSFEGPAHFNFLINEIGIEEKSFNRIACKINGLKLPGYYSNSCQKKAVKPTPTPSAPVRTTPTYDYQYVPQNNGGASSQ
ncbi:MAG: hypothetical protein EP326_12225 [Deltaproteobacteria bacterium]|nr:MAG: hypothetical protein EP326_12225 [Deltaproteobacteria bacterium]